MFDVGQEIWCIEVKNERWNEAEVSGFLYMGKCGDYIIASSEYAHCEGDFEAQLEEMYEESLDDCGVDMFLLKSKYCFETLNQAEDYLNDMVLEYD